MGNSVLQRESCSEYDIVPDVIWEVRQSATMENLLATLEDPTVRELDHKSRSFLNHVDKMMTKSSFKTRSLTPKDCREVNIFLQTLLDLVLKLGSIYQVSVDDHCSIEEEVIEMRALCEQKDREIQSKESEVEQLQSVVSRRDAIVKALQHKIHQHTPELDQMKVLLIEKDQTNQNLQQHLSSKDMEIQNLQKDIAQLLSEKNELKDKMEQCYARNDRLHQDCLTKESQIDRLEEQLLEEGRIKKQLEERIASEMAVASQLKRNAKQDSQQHERECLKQANKI